ncbi:small nuclear ribonucleoprotein Sm D3 [Solea senegalensis]|nr:small nuclear ribonucleoprotein Sm D3 [Solea senegalensis]
MLYLLCVDLFKSNFSECVEAAEHLIFEIDNCQWARTPKNYTPLNAPREDTGSTPLTYRGIVGRRKKAQKGTRNRREHVVQSRVKRQRKPVPTHNQGKPVKMSIGVPIKVLHEAEGHIVTCETNTGEVYRGKLIEAEDNMNCQMSNITVTYRDGRVAQLEQVYIRGSKIRFLILPDMLKNAPMLKSMKNKNQGSGAGRGKAAILKAQVAARGRGRGGMGRGNIFQKRR